MGHRQDAFCNGRFFITIRNRFYETSIYLYNINWQFYKMYQGGVNGTKIIRNKLDFITSKSVQSLYCQINISNNYCFSNVISNITVHSNSLRIIIRSYLYISSVFFNKRNKDIRIYNVVILKNPSY